MVVVTVEYDEEKQLEKKKEKEDNGNWIIDMFARIDRLLGFLGVNIFGHGGRWWWKLLCVINLMFCMGLVLHFIIKATRVLIKTTPDAKTLPSSLGLVTFAIQAIFLVLWQRGHRTEKAVAMLSTAQHGRGIHRYSGKLRLITRLYAMALGLVFIFMLGRTASIYFDESHAAPPPPTQEEERLGAGQWPLPAVEAVGTPRSSFSYKELFGHGAWYFVFFVALVQLSLCWLAAMFQYVIILHTANAEVRACNEAIARIKMDEYKSEETTSRLSELLSGHGALMAALKALNEIFKARNTTSSYYIFAMLVSILPLMASLLFLPAGQNISDSVRLSIRGVAEILRPFTHHLMWDAFCLFVFVALTAGPTRLFSALHTTKKILCANKNIWHPYRMNVYMVANSFMHHVDTADSGMTVAGLVTIRKRLVVLLLSLFLVTAVTLMEGKRFLPTL